jgi:hypothetical protein
MDLPIGRSFDCRFGAFVPRLRFLTAESVQLDIPSADGVARQVVSTKAMRVADGIFMLSWIEADGTVVVHVQDFAAMAVFSHARLPDGTLVRSRGTIEWADEPVVSA